MLVNVGIIFALDWFSRRIGWPEMPLHLVCIEH